MADSAVGILGLGFTGIRVARRLAGRGVRVVAAVRGVGRFAGLAGGGIQLTELAGAARGHWPLAPGAPVLYSIPPVGRADRQLLLNLIHDSTPGRVVYLSSTGIYGNREFVNERTPPGPADERGWARLEDENRLADGPWKCLILRPAAIYGPNRGVHAAVRTGRQPRGIGANRVSRIHVDDLAALCEAGLLADLEGAWPAADRHPSSSTEILQWCGVTPDLINPDEISGKSRGRWVDGRAVCARLGVRLTHESWRTGVPASLAEENAKQLNKT